jgi:hypothetical protein
VVLLLLQLLFLLGLLVVNGEPLRAGVLRRFRLFSDLDFIQVCILNVYVGGLILYAIAILPFGFFRWEVVIGFTLLNAILCLAIHFKPLVRSAHPSKLKSLIVGNRKALLTYLAVFLMLLVFLIVNLSSVSGLVFGSVRDESIHSLDVQVILENHFVPLTLQPYLPEGIVYPQAAHVIFAFSSYVLNMDVPQVVFYVTLLFKSLSVLGAYFLGRKLSANNVFGLGLSFVFAFMSSWPLYVVWGGNPFLVGFPLFLVCLGLLFSFFRSNERHNIVELVILGLLVGFAGSLIISYLETLIVVIILVFVYFLFQSRAGIRRVFRELAIVLGVSFIPLSPFIFRFVTFYAYPGHNVGVASDFSGWTSQQFYLSQALQWAIDNLSPYILLKVITLFLLFSLPILVWKTKLSGDVKSVAAFALAIFAAATFLSFISFFLSPDFGVISWGHQGLLLSIPIGILIVVSYLKFAEFFRGFKIKRLSKFLAESSSGGVLLIIVVLSLVTAPFLYYRLFVDAQELRISYDIFAVTSESDYELMSWMKNNLSPDAVVLVHPFGSGLFIPSISHHRVIFPYTGSSLSSSYQTLVGLLENNTLNSEAYQILHSWNITHVFVGTNVAYWMFNYPRWDPKLLLGNPNFKLVKNIGSSYLFELREQDADLAFYDDFNSAPWHQYGWRNETLGNGHADVSAEDHGGVNDSGCLLITAQALPGLAPTSRGPESGFVNWVEREVFVPNSQNVTLSFYLNAKEGFNGIDTFAIIIYNMNRSQAMAITSPNGSYLGFSTVATMNSQEGLFDFNLSQLWEKEFNSPLPKAFVLQFANYDFDGVPNVAHIDSVTISSNDTVSLR